MVILANVEPVDMRQITMEHMVEQFNESIESFDDRQPVRVLRSRKDSLRKSITGMPWGKISGLIRDICLSEKEIRKRLSDKSHFKNEPMTYEQALDVIGATRVEIAKQRNRLNDEDIKTATDWYITRNAKSKRGNGGISADDIYQWVIAESIVQDHLRYS